MILVVIPSDIQNKRTIIYVFSAKRSSVECAPDAVESGDIRR